MTASPAVAELVTYYLIAVNFAAFAAFGLDKSFAETGSWRIREDTLLFIAFIGGWPGAMAGRQAFRHKTRKESFSRALWGVPLFQLLLAGFCALFFWLDGHEGEARDTSSHYQRQQIGQPASSLGQD